MKIAGVFSFNNGKEVIESIQQELLMEVKSAIRAVDASVCKLKTSREKTMPGKVLYSPKAINAAFKRAFEEQSGWSPVRVGCDYPTEYYVDGYKNRVVSRGAFREMDFVKGSLGVEVQFGKYAFMVYNVCAKMTIFQKMGYIKYGVEIVPVKALAEEMSTGVSYFEQFVWDLEHRGVSDIDIPVMVIGIDI